MMNRSLMGRQMFANGGMAMPDPMAAPDPMAGLAGLDPGMAMAAPDPMATGGLDPTALNDAMMAASESFGSLDDAEDYEGMINAIRGDQLPMADRIEELGDLVGMEDAQQTPQSVVALIQPVMLMNSMDQGIGSIAEDAMGAEITGDMAGGIMSTVNMEPPMDPGMNPAMAQAMPMDTGMPMGMEVGNAPPVNFRYGGSVAHMQAGGDPTLAENFEARQTLYSSLIPPQVDTDQDIERQRELTQAQMLFDVANTALAFATPGSTTMSPAQRLAEAATETKLLDKIGARAATQFTADQARKAATRDEKMKMDLLALGSAETMSTAQAKARAARRLADASAGVQNFYDNDGTIFTVLKGSPEYFKAIRENVATGPKSQSQTDQLGGINYRHNVSGALKTVAKGSIEEKKLIDDPDYNLTGAASQSGEGLNLITMYNPETQKEVNVVKGSADIPQLMTEGFLLRSTPGIEKGPEVSDEIQIISDPDTLAAYASGDLSDRETNQLEQILTQYNTSTQQVLNGSTVQVPAKPLTNAQIRAIKTRMANGLPTSKFDLPEDVVLSGALLDLSEAGDFDSKVEVLNNFRDPDTGSLPKNILRSVDFNETLLRPSGAINLDSPTWRMVPTAIFNPEVTYESARGIGTIPDRVGQFFGEVARETGVGRLSTDGRMVYQADNDFLALKLQTLGVLTQHVTTGRVLATVQKEINRVLEPLQPGVFAFDGKTRAAVKSISGQLALALKRQTDILPEYNGDSSRATGQQIPEARAAAGQLRDLLAEYVQFGDAMDLFLSGEKNVGGRAGGLTKEESQKKLYEAASQNEAAYQNAFSNWLNNN